LYRQLKDQRKPRVSLCKFISQQQQVIAVQRPLAQPRCELLHSQQAIVEQVAIQSLHDAA
jgi:hypothetical protein